MNTDAIQSEKDKDLRELKKIKMKMNEIKQVLDEKRKNKADCNCKTKGKCIELLMNRYKELKKSYDDLYKLIKNSE